MSTETTNYNLKKPELTDTIAQTVGIDIPANMDSIDTLIKAVNDAITTVSNAVTALTSTVDALGGADISLDTASFTNNLDATITTVQKLADAVDDLALGISSVSASDLTAGTVDLDIIDLQNSDNSVVVSNASVSITGGKFSYSNASGVPIIDDYGIDPQHFDNFKNMVKNSGFERFDPSSAVDYPVHWTGGRSEADSSFYGSFSCELLASESVETNSDSYINPADFDNSVARVSFHRKNGQMKLEVYDVTNSQYFTLTDEDGNSGASITFAATSNWNGSRASARFDPTQHGACTQFKIVITNVHASETGYIDAVMVTPDYNGKYPQIYKPGANSDTYPIVISDTSPTDTSVLWVDTSA